MREYIHFFENSGLRDTYENGSNYTEPYVSYTPVINEYKAQFNGHIVEIFKIEKIQGGYKVKLYASDKLVTEEEVLTNSDSFYFSSGSFIFPEDLNLTEESTEFNFHGGPTFYLEYYENNTWNVYRDSGHTQKNGQIRKLDIVSVPSSSNDFVHYNKIPPAKSIYAKINIKEPNSGTKETDPLYIKISDKKDIFERIIIDNGADVIEFNNEKPTKGQSFDVYYQFSTYGVHNIEYVLKDEYAGIMPGGIIPSYSVSFNEITLPKGIYKIESRAIDWSNYTGNYLNLNIPNTIIEVEDYAIICTPISSEVEDFLLSINSNSIDNNCK